ncbi:MAG: phosphatidylserine decarboxylase family protein [candidate division Zixibacteria bacterium]|nr:phosphatidylserine decarboxylase family protein [candidate division Zixibacteria bacterium]
MAKEGLGIIFFSLILTIIFFLLSVLTRSKIVSGFTVLFLVITLFIVFFFRDPDREITQGEGIILSPADGRIVEIAPFSENGFLNSGGTKVSIFLSLWDVHINRNPISGVVKYAKYIPGSFNAAYKEKASSENEQNELGLENSQVKLILKQIAGTIARRIVCRIKEGDQVKIGERFGMIKFGSRAELFLPEKVKVLVKLNQQVRAGETVIGTYDVCHPWPESRTFG